MAYEDLLKDTSQYVENGDYFLLTITDLNISTSYPIQFRWKRKDGSFGVWSNAKTITTPGESFPNTPSTLTVVGGAGILTVTWDGKDGSGNNLVNFDRVDIYIDGLPFDGTKATASLYGAGVKTIVAPAGTYIVAAYAVSKAGTRSAVNTPVTRTVTSNVPTPENSVTPSTPTVSSVLGAIQLSWNGKTSSGGDQPYGFDAAKVYVGTSSSFTPSSANQVDKLNFANGQNTLNIGVGTIVDGVALDYGIDYYVKIATTNGTDTSTAVSASGNPVRIGQVTSGDIVTINADKIATGTLASGSTITVGSTSGKHIKLSGTGDPFIIYGSGGTSNPVLSYNGTKLTVVGDGTFTGDISGATGTLTNALNVGTASGGLYPFSVSSSGVIRAISGTIGGFTLANDYLSSTNFKISSGDAALYVGNVNSTHLRISASGGIATYNGGTQTSGFNLSTSGTLTLSGTITAASGSTLGGWTSGSSYFYGGNMRLNSDGSITTGTGGTAGNFSVNSSGTLTASNVDLTGKITANSGSIGGWTISGTGFITGYSTTLGGAFYSISTTLPISADWFSATGVTKSQFDGGMLVGGASTFNDTAEFNYATTFDATATFNQELVAYYGLTNYLSASPNVYMTSGGGVRKTTGSSIRYKKDIVDLSTVEELNPYRLYDLPVRAFKFKELNIEDSRYNKLLPGFIAEEVEEIYPIAADYDIDGVEKWNSQIMIPAMLSLIQDLNRRLDALEG